MKKTLFLIFMLSCTMKVFSNQVKVFSDNYWGLGLNYNIPQDKSKKIYKTAPLSVDFNYINVINQKWMIALEVGFIRFSDIQSQVLKEVNSLKFLSFKQDVTYNFLLFHPVYFAIGWRFSYLYPVLSFKLPPKKNSYYKTNFGIGLVARFNVVIVENQLAAFRLTKWRGTKNNNIHSMELALSYSYSL